MTKNREIIRLTGMGFFKRGIMASCSIAQKTVVKVQKCVREINLSWSRDKTEYSGFRVYAGDRFIKL